MQHPLEKPLITEPLTGEFKGAIPKIEPASQSVLENYRPSTRREIPEKDAADIRKLKTDDTLNTWAAGLADVNPISAYIRYPDVDYNRYQEGYNPFTDPVDKKRIAGMPPEAFTASFSPDTTTEVIRKIGKQRQDRELLGRHTGVSVASDLLGTIGDPLLYLGGPMEMGLMGLAKTAGKEMLLETASETLMLAQQPERGIERAMTEILLTGAGVSLLGGGFQAYAGAMTRNAAKVDVATDELRQAQEAFDSGDIEAANAAVDRSASAMEVPRETLETLAMTPGVFNFATLASPVANAYKNTQSVAMREFLSEFAPLSFQTKKSAEGVAQPVTLWSRGKQADVDSAMLNNEMAKNYLNYKKDGGMLSESGFGDEVGRAMRNNDVSPNGIQAATDLAKIYRVLDDELFEKAAKLGLYGDEIQLMMEKGVRPQLKGAPSHLQRIYKREVLREPKIKRALKAKFVPKLMVELQNPENRIFKHESGALEMINIKDRDQFALDNPTATIQPATHASVATMRMQAEEIADTIVRNMSGGGAKIETVNPEYIVPKPGTLHERTMGLLSDVELDELGVLVNDARDVLEVTSREMRREIALQETYGERDLKSIKTAIAKDYEARIADAPDAKAVKSLESRMGKDIQLVDDLRGLFLGTFQIPDTVTGVLTNANRLIRVYNTVGLLVAPFITNLPDAFTPMFRQGAAPILKSMIDLNRLGYKSGVEMVQAYGIATEAITGQRMSVMMEGHGQQTAFMQKTYNIWGKFGGMNLITDWAQAVAGLSQIRIWNKQFNNFSKLRKKDISRLAEAGFDSQNIPAIKAQMDKYAQKIKGDFVDPNTARWTDLEAKEIFENAVRSEIKGRQVLEPMPGDTPLIFESGKLGESGKTAGQFMRYPYTMTQRFLVLGLQRKDAEFLAGFLFTSMVGGIVHGGKEVARGREIGEEQAIMTILNGIDRGGSMGLIGMLPPAVYAVATGERSGRYFMKSPWNTFLGPGPQPAYNALSSVMKLVTGQAQNEDEVYRALRSIPVLNWWYAMDLFRLMTEGPGYRE